MTLKKLIQSAYNKTKREMLSDLKKNLHAAEHPSAGPKKGNKPVKEMIYTGGVVPVKASISDTIEDHR